MIYYVFFLIILILASYLEVVKKIKISKGIYVILCVLLAFFAGLRWQIGTDFNQYYRIFNLIIENRYWPNDIEKSYFFISRILGDFRLVLLFFSFSSIIFACNYIEKTKYPFTSLLLFFSFTFLSYNMGRMRVL